MPGRCISVSIFCIQFSPTIRFPSFTKGSRPQKVTKTLVLYPTGRGGRGQDQDRPDLVELAADQLTITSSLTFVGSFNASL